MSLKQRINRLRREVTALEEDQQPIVVFISGHPEPTRRLGRSMGEREGMVGGELIAALDGETIKAFHARLAGIARERVAGLGRRVITVSIGSGEPVKQCRYNLDGTPITLN